jgi:hypothetical protein
MKRGVGTGITDFPVCQERAAEVRIGVGLALFSPRTIEMHLIAFESHFSGPLSAEIRVLLGIALELMRRDQRWPEVLVQWKGSTSRMLDIIFNSL